MKTNDEKGKELFSNNPLQRIYHKYGAGVAYICVLDQNGDECLYQLNYVPGFRLKSVPVSEAQM